MIGENNQPKSTDVVLGGQKTPQRGTVLGGLSDLKRQLESCDIEKRLIALQKLHIFLFQIYGKSGLTLLDQVKIQDQKALVKDKKTPIQFKYQFAESKKTSPEILDILALEEDWSIRRMVARNPNTSVKTLQDLARYEVDYLHIKEIVDRLKIIVESLADNPNTPVATLRQLAQYRCDEISVGMIKVAKNRSTPADTLEKLAKDKNWLVRSEVAENPNTPPEILKTLACDKNKDVRIKAVTNPNFSDVEEEEVLEDGTVKVVVGRWV